MTRMDRILKYAGCSEETFILALIYMDQVRRTSPLYYLRQSRIHLVLGCSLFSATTLEYPSSSTCLTNASEFNAGQVVQFNPDFVISSLNVHRLLITSIMLASKFFDDVYYNNAYYARVGGISNTEV